MNSDGATIFERKHYAETEYGTSTDINVVRHTDGSMHVVVGSWAENTDRSAKSYVLSAEDAEILGRVLVCTEDNFKGIVERSMEATK